MRRTIAAMAAVTRYMMIAARAISVITEISSLTLLKVAMIRQGTAIL